MVPLLQGSKTMKGRTDQREPWLEASSCCHKETSSKLLQPPQPQLQQQLHDAVFAVLELHSQEWRECRRLAWWGGRAAVAAWATCLRVPANKANTQTYITAAAQQDKQGIEYKLDMRRPQDSNFANT